MKVSMSNLEVEYIEGHLIKFDKMNLSIQEPHKIIVNNKNYSLVALIYANYIKIRYNISRFDPKLKNEPHHKVWFFDKIKRAPPGKEDS